MIDFEKIVEDVRNSLVMQGEENGDFLRSVVADFAVACDEVNGRLQQCESLLRRGLRSEALHLCELEPNLLDTVATLDFPERELWEEFIGQAGMALPMPLNVAAAEALSEAYAIEKPMAGLLRSHRLLALAHAPLADRIKTLRQLAQADMENPVWATDVEAFERVRVDQLRNEASIAAKRRDLKALRRLRAEVEAPGWLHRPGTSVVQEITTAHSRVLHAHVRERLQQLGQDLNDTFAAFDVARAREHRAAWNKMLDTPGFVIEAELAEQAAPALEWLDEQDRLEQRRQHHLAAVAVMEQALQRKRLSLEKLERLYHNATSGGEELTPALQRRYQSRVEALKLSSTRRIRLVVLAIVGVLVLTGAGVWWAIDRSIRQSHLDGIRQSLAKLIEADDLPAAEQYVAQLRQQEQAALAEPEVAALAAKVGQLVEEERRRRERFEGAVARVEQSLARKESEPFAPDMAALSAAKDAAKADEEKAAVADLTRQIEQTRAVIRRRGIDKLEQECRKIGTQLAVVERREYTNLDRYAQPLQAIRASLDTVRAGSDKLQASHLFSQRASDHAERLAKLEQWVQQTTREEEVLRSVTHSVGDCDAYAATLSEYAREFEETPRGRDFAELADDRMAWIASVRLSTLVQRWRSDVPAKLDHDVAEQYLTMIEALGDLAFDQSYTGLRKAAGQRVPFLKAIAARKANEAKDALQRLLNQPILRECWCVRESNNGGRYYLLEEPSLKSGYRYHVFQYAIDAAGSRRTGGMVEAENAGVGVAPQVALARGIRTRLADLSHVNWESQFYAILEAIRNDKETDPLLRFDMLRLALKAACEGSVPMATAFESSCRRFRHTDVNLFANWVDPKDTDASEARQQAETELHALPAWTARWAKIQEELEALRKPPGEQYRWVGWLRRNWQGNWVAVLPTGVSAQGTTFTFTLDQQDITRLSIGTLNLGELSLTLGVGRLREGMPLFVEVPAQGKK